MQEYFARIAEGLQRSSPVDIDGAAFTITLRDIRDPASPVETLHAKVTFVGEGAGQVHFGELMISRDRLADTAYVVDTAIETIEQIVRGDLPPGTHSQL